MRGIPIDVLKYFAYTSIVAFILTWIFDIFEVLIKEKSDKYTYWILNMKDLCAVIIFCLSLIITLYYCNKGIFRGIYLGAMFWGIFLYSVVFSKILRKLSRILLMPLVNIIAVIIKIIRKIISFCLVSIEKKYTKLYNRIKNCRS